MFVRFRLTPTRFQVSLVETRRVDGRVRHEHVASLGSIAMPARVADRIQFWSRLHERLGKLSNRVTDIGKVLGDVHARIPMVTPDEQRALQLENAEADQQFWGALSDLHQDMADSHGNLAAPAERAAANNRGAAETATKNAADAKERVERIKRGENVTGGLGKAQTYEDFERALGKKVVRRARATNTLHKLGALGELKDEIEKRTGRARDTATRAVMRRYGLNRLTPDEADAFVDEIVAELGEEKTP